MAMQTISIEEATRRIREGAHIDAMDPDGPAAHPGLRAALDDALIAELEAGRIIAGWDEEKQQLGPEEFHTGFLCADLGRNAFTTDSCVSM